MSDTSHDRVRARFDHVAIAVRSIEQAVQLFRDVLGAEFVSGGDDERLGIRTVQYRMPPGVKIELMQPLRDDAPLARFMESRGEGFHHMTTFWPDLEEAIARAEAAGFEMVDTDLADPGWRESYLRPRAGFGTLQQFVDTDRDWSSPIPGITEEKVLAGEVVWEGATPRLREPRS